MNALTRRATMRHAPEIERRQRQIPRLPDRVVGAVMVALLIALAVWQAYDMGAQQRACPATVRMVAA